MVLIKYFNFDLKGLLIPRGAKGVVRTPLDLRSLREGPLRPREESGPCQT